VGSILTASVFHNNSSVAFPVAHTLVLMLLDDEGAADELAKLGSAVEFLEDQYRHCKTIFVMGASSILLDKAGIEGTLPKGKADPV
jgi:hypothetical protein